MQEYEKRVSEDIIKTGVYKTVQRAFGDLALEQESIRKNMNRKVFSRHVRNGAVKGVVSVETKKHKKEGFCYWTRDKYEDLLVAKSGKGQFPCLDGVKKEKFSILKTGPDTFLF